MTNPRIKFLLVSSISIWWGWTVLTDFFIAPTIFKIIPDFFLAGEVGMTLFNKLNHAEFILSIIILSLSFIPKRSKLLISLAFILLLISVSYLFFLTPKIQVLTTWWKEAESLGLTSIHGIADIQQEHQKYHKLYVSIDAIKLILLTSGLGFLIFKHEPKHA